MDKPRHPASKHHQHRHKTLVVIGAHQAPPSPGRLIHMMDAGHGWLHLESNVPANGYGMASDCTWLIPVALFAVMIGKRLARHQAAPR